MTDTDQTTTLPCPPWCELKAGHPFHSITEDGFLLRSHEKDQSVDTGVSVAILADETAATDNGPAAAGEPRVWINVDDIRSGRFTSPQVRRIAAALLNAADELDRITGASS